MDEAPKIIQRYISQKCIGYNANFTKTYYESVAVFTDGTTATIYETRQGDNATIDYSLTQPIVEVSV